MKKIIVLVILTQSTFAQKLKEITLDKKQYKLRTTFSDKVNDSSSLHFIVAKNIKTKKIDFLPFLIGKESKNLTPFSFDKEPVFLSKHIYNNKLVLIYRKAINRKEIYSRTFDFKADKIAAPKLIFDKDYEYNSLITTDSTAVFVSFSTISINVTTVYDSEKRVENVFASKNKKDQDILKGLKTTNVFLNSAPSKYDYVTTKEYVEIGSIKAGHLFLNSNVLTLTRDVKKKALTIFLNLDLNKTEKQYLVFSEFKNKLQKVKQIRSFYYEDKLFQFAVSSKDAAFQIFDINTGLVLKTFDYTKSNFGPYNKYFFKSKEVEPNPSRFFNSFKKFRPYSLYFPNIFIVANKSKDNGVVVEMGHINGAVYNYNNYIYMWQMQMQDMMRMQNNMIKNFSPPSFRGPNDAGYFNEGTMFEEDIRKTSFVLSLDKDFNKTENVTETTLKKDVWKEKIDILKKDNNKKYLSYYTKDNSLRCMYYFEKINKIIIREYSNND